MGLSAARTVDRFSRGPKWFAMAWGFAEATLFFIVPDVLLSAAALGHFRTALLLLLWTLFGALLGGGLMYAWGAFDGASARAAVAMVPAVSVGMLEAVRADLLLNGALAIVMGPFQGIPYKTYAVQAAATGVSPALFMLVSIPARALRFLAVSMLAAFISGVILARVSIQTKRWLLAICWIVFYGTYFHHMMG